jgi:hypothetical protein
VGPPLTSNNKEQLLRHWGGSIRRRQTAQPLSIDSAKRIPCSPPTRVTTTSTPNVGRASKFYALHTWTSRIREDTIAAVEFAGVLLGGTVLRVHVDHALHRDHPRLFLHCVNRQCLWSVCGRCYSNRPIALLGSVAVEEYPNANSVPSFAEHQCYVLLGTFCLHHPSSPLTTHRHEVAVSANDAQRARCADSWSLPVGSLCDHRRVPCIRPNQGNGPGG